MFIDDVVYAGDVWGLREEPDKTPEGLLSEDYRKGIISSNLQHNMAL